MIFKNEMKRILRPAVLSMIVCLTVIWYFAFMSDCNLYLEDNFGQPYAVAREYARRFGPAIDDTEIDEVRADYEAASLVRDAVYEKYLGSYGIHNREEFESYEEQNFEIFMDEKGDQCKHALAEWGEEEYRKRKKTFDEIYKIVNSGEVFRSNFLPQSIQYFVKAWDFQKEEREALKMNSEEWYFSDASEEAKEWLNAFLSEKQEVSLLQELQSNFYFDIPYGNWNILILICCALVTLPYLVRNNISNVTSMLYSSKKGRKIIGSQLLAVLASSGIVILVLTGVFQIFYFKKDTSFLFHSRINSAAHASALWLDLTYLQYMLLSWAETFVMSLCAVLIMFWISCYSRNYVTAMAAAVPVILVFRFILEKLNGTLSVFNYPSFLFWLCLFIPIILSVGVSIFMKYRADKTDYLVN